mgnify:CR=1 FL=1
MEHLAIFHWFSKYNFVCIPVLAFLLDLIIGDPNSKYHPVAIIGRIISFFEAVLYKDTDNDTKKLLYGGIAVGLILISVYIGGVVDEWVYYAFEVVILYIAISPRSLAGAGFTISQLIKQGNIVDARKRLSWIVGRDTEDLDESEITRATVETIAENTVDGIIAPFFFFIIGGPMGAILYRTANTMDSMLGYKNQKYLYFGRVAARFDDILNWIPARITFVLFVISAFFLRFDAKKAIEIGLRDAKKHPSPNGGYAEAPVAGALHIRLGGYNQYFKKMTFREYMGDPIEKLNRNHITRTIYMMYVTTILMVIISTVITYGMNV